MSYIDYEHMTDRELAIAANRKLDRILAKTERAEEMLADMVRDIGPVIDGMKSGGVAGLVRALF